MQLESTRGKRGGRRAATPTRIAATIVLAICGLVGALAPVALALPGKLGRHLLLLDCGEDEAGRPRAISPARAASASPARSRRTTTPTTLPATEPGGSAVGVQRRTPTASQHQPDHAPAARPCEQRVLHVEVPR